MKQKLLFVSAFLTLALALSACGPQSAPATDVHQPAATEAPVEPVTPGVEVMDQDISDGSVTVPSVNMAVDGWVVIHTTNAEGKPGPVIGYAPVPAGTSSDVQVSIEADQATPQLFAMLHIDTGVAGTYEFPGDDVPVKDGEAIVMKPFNLSGLKATVSVGDQEVNDGSVMIDSTFMLQPGWVVIHTTNAEGKPGPVIGYAALPVGSSQEVLVGIEADQITPQLFAMLHVDAGMAGMYEFPGEDVPVKDGEAIVMKPFNLNGLSPFVRTSDQAIQDDMVTVDATFMTQAGWVVIHTTNAEGKPGPVIGYAALPEGFSSNVPVTIDTASATPKLFAMLHVDAGTAGTYEFPGDDVPVTTRDAVVMIPFSTEESSSSVEVDISNFSFGPNELEVKVGTTVTWTNKDNAEHTVTADDGTFDSGTLGKGSSFSYTFTEAGSFPYFCEFHYSMTGVVTVVQ